LADNRRVSTDRAFSFKRLAFLGLAVGLIVAALASIAALLGGDFDETELRVIATSMAFALYSSLAAAGAATRLGEGRALRTLGSLALALSIVSFLLLTWGIWSDGDSGDVLWRTFGAATVIAFASVHGALVLQARVPADSDPITLVVRLSLAFGAIDAAGALLPISGIYEDLGEDYAKLFGVGLVLLVLTTALPPVLRRAQRASSTPAAGDGRVVAVATGRPPAPARVFQRDKAPRADSREAFAREVIAVADRLEAIAPSLDGAAAAVQAEIEQLRRLARSFPV
jgi:hypothetical protein